MGVSGNKDAASIADGPSVFPDEFPPEETPSGAEFQGLKPADCPLAMLKNGRHRMSLKCANGLGGSLEEIVAPGGQL